MLGVRLLGDSLNNFLDNFLSGGGAGISGGAAGGIDSLDSLDSLFGGLGGLLGIVVATGSNGDHHSDDGDGHKYLFHGQMIITS